MPSIAKGLLPARRVAGWACSASSPGTAWPTCTGAMASISASKPGRLAAALVRAASLREGSMDCGADGDAAGDRKSTRLNSSHSQISYAVFCLKKKKQGLGESEVRPGRHSGDARQLCCRDSIGRDPGDPGPQDPRLNSGDRHPLALERHTTNP